MDKSDINVVDVLRLLYCDNISRGGFYLNLREFEFSDFDLYCDYY